MTKHAFFLLACVLALFLVSCEKDEDNRDQAAKNQAAIAAELAGMYSGRYAFTIEITATTPSERRPLRLFSLSTPSGTTKEATVTATVDPDNDQKLSTIANLEDVDFMQALNPAYENDIFAFVNILSEFRTDTVTVAGDDVRIATGYTAQNTERLPLIATKKILSTDGNSIPMVLSNIDVTDVSALNATFRGRLEMPEEDIFRLFPEVIRVIDNLRAEIARELNARDPDREIEAETIEISNISINLTIKLSDMAKQ